MAKNFDEASCAAALKRKGVIFKKNQISLEDVTTGLGNGSFARLDYLVNYCKYVVVKAANEKETLVYAPSKMGQYPANSYQNPGKKFKRAVKRLTTRRVDYNAQTTNRCSGQQFTCPGSMQK